MMLADESPQVRPDLAGSLKACRLRFCLLVFRGDISALGIMLQIAEHPDGKDVPLRALVPNKDKVLRLFQDMRVSVLHLPFFIKIVELAREGYEHLHVEKGSLCKCLAQVG